MNTLHQPPEQRNLRKLAGFLTSAYIDKAAEVTGEADVGELGRDVLPVKTQDIGTVVEFQVAHGSREFLQHVVGVSHGAGLVPEFVVFHPVFDLLVGHVEVALLLVQGGLAISSGLSSKSKTSMFSWMCLGLEEPGTTQKPF